MCTTTSRVKGGHFTGFIDTVFTQSDQINHRLFYQIPLNSSEKGKFHGKG